MGNSLNSGSNGGLVNGKTKEGVSMAIKFYGITFPKRKLKYYDVLGRIARQKKIPVTKAHAIAKRVIKEGLIERVEIRTGKFRYMAKPPVEIPPVVEVPIERIDLKIMDKSTGDKLYALPDTQEFATYDENDKETGRHKEITISVTFSVDTDGGHQRLVLYETTAFITIPYTTDIREAESKVVDFIKDAVAYKFNPAVANVIEIKEGVEAETSPISTSREIKLILEYGHGSSRSEKSGVMEITENSLSRDKTLTPKRLHPYGRPPGQKTL